VIEENGLAHASQAIEYEASGRASVRYAVKGDGGAFDNVAPPSQLGWRIARAGSIGISTRVHIKEVYYGLSLFANLG